MASVIFSFLCMVLYSCPNGLQVLVGSVSFFKKFSKSGCSSKLNNLLFLQLFIKTVNQARHKAITRTHFINYFFAPENGGIGPVVGRIKRRVIYYTLLPFFKPERTGHCFNPCETFHYPGGGLMRVLKIGWIVVVLNQMQIQWNG